MCTAFSDEICCFPLWLLTVDSYIKISAVFESNAHVNVTPQGEGGNPGHLTGNLSHGWGFLTAFSSPTQGKV